MTVTGKHLYASTGDDIGEVNDVLGGDGSGQTSPAWISVKTGLLSQRLVPFDKVDDQDDRLTTKLAPEEVKSAPKVPAHIAPAGEDLDALRSHYGLDQL